MAHLIHIWFPELRICLYTHTGTIMTPTTGEGHNFGLYTWYLWVSGT